MTTDNRPLIIIAGPTAVGKSACAIELAKELNGEVISADSMQVYRGMDIGSAKVTKEEMDGVVHHLIDVIDPSEDYSVVRFKEMAEAAYADVLSRGKMPILCGGTGFYIQAFLYDIDFTEEEDDSDSVIRARLTKEVETSGAEALHARLREVDPLSAERIPAGNVKRVIRALEFYEMHGCTISSHNDAEHQKHASSPYDYRFFVLTDERSAIYERINQRVDRMMESGLYEETRALFEAGIRADSTAAKGIGYRQMYEHLEGKTSLSEAIEKIKIDSRHYAKKQLTWFKREEQAVWIDIRNGDTVNEIRKHLW